MFAETAELNNDRKEFYKQFVKCMKHGIREDYVDDVETAEFLRFNTSKPGDAQISFDEHADRMKEGQNDIFCITGESIAAVSSRSFQEHSRKKGYEALHVADPVDEYAVQQLEEFDGTELKQSMKEGLDLGEQDDKKTLGELNIESKPLRKLMKEALGDKVEEAVVNDRVVDSSRALTKSEHGLSAVTERIMRAQAARDDSRHTMSEYGWSANMKHIVQQPRGSQQQRQSTRQRERKKGEKRRRKKRKS